MVDPVGEDMPIHGVLERYNGRKYNFRVRLGGCLLFENEQDARNYLKKVLRCEIDSNGNCS